MPVKACVHCDAPRLTNDATGLLLTAVLQVHDSALVKVKSGESYRVKLLMEVLVPVALLADKEERVSGFWGFLSALKVKIDVEGTMMGAPAVTATASFFIAALFNRTHLFFQRDASLQNFLEPGFHSCDDFVAKLLQVFLFGQLL